MFIWRIRAASAPIQRWYVGSDAVRNRQTECLPPETTPSSRRDQMAQRISNSNLYERCECREINTDVMDMRWRLFGHVLTRKRRQTRRCQPISKRRDFKDIAADPEPASPGRLTPISRSACALRPGLTWLRRIALNRTGWRILHTTILGKRCKRS